MDEPVLRELLSDVRAGRRTIDQAIQALRHLPFEDLGFAKVDHHRAIRCGFPEVIYCQGKQMGQVVAVAERRLAGGGNVLATRASPEVARAMKRRFRQAQYNKLAQTITIRQKTTAGQRTGARWGSGTGPEATGTDEGFVSRIVSRLEREGYIVREDKSAIRPKDPALLLDAWRESYQFSKHTIYQGHVAARAGDALLKFTCDTLARQNVEHAATGLAAAWAFTRFAAFRIATVYLADEPSSELIEKLTFREDSRGANLWLVVPNDAGVFHGAVEKDGIRCVHPVQAYLDLKGHPERASEAAERLRNEFLNWRRGG